MVVEAGAGADAGDGVSGADAEGVERVGGVEDVGVVPAGGDWCEGEIAAEFADGACGFANGEECEEKDGGRGGDAGGVVRR